MFFQMNLLTVAFYSFDRPKEIRNLSGPAHGFGFLLNTRRMHISCYYWWLLILGCFIFCSFISSKR